MPRLSPFPALRYTPSAGKLEDVLAPPYDVIDAEMADELRSRNSRNAVRLILPEGDVSSRYEKAAADLEAWSDAGTLATEDEPSVYVYRQQYEVAGEPVTRLALFAALDLVPLDTGEVLPHEHTHAGPKKDRLALTLATRTQMSPVFMAGRDPESDLLSALADVTDRSAPVTSGQTEDGIHHALWPVAGQAADGLCRLVDRYPLLIADGHHRYETALEAKRQMESPSAGKMLVCIVSENDPGLVIQPTHRTLTNLPPAIADVFVDRLGDRFHVQQVDGTSPGAAAAMVADSPAELVVVHGGSMWRLAPKVNTAADAGSSYGIAAVLFDEWIMNELLGSDADTAAHDGTLEYHREPDYAVVRAGKSGAAFLLPPVSMEALWSVTSEGVRLPAKSTYFEPKMPSGLLFRPL
jgi:uncharacterized protein (DUF1015 family)